LIPDVSFQFETGVRRFNTTRELRVFLRELLTSYERSRDAVDLITADMLRDGQGMTEAQSKGWFKVDELYVNKSDQTRAGLDILFQILRESTPKLRIVEDALRAFDKFEAMGVPEDTTVLLYMRDGIPSRLVLGEYQEPVTEGPTKGEKKAK
jgi:hypothetical protein